MFWLPGCQVSQCCRRLGRRVRVRAWHTEHDMTSEMCPLEGVTLRGNESETLRELNLFLTGGRLSPTGQKIVRGV